MHPLKKLLLAAGGIAAIALAAGPLNNSALGAGADILHSGLGGGIFNAGAVGGINAYALGSDTCNIGDLNLAWTNNGTPGLSMNAYRLSDGRLVQIGIGMLKTACCAAASPLCNMSCNGQGGSVLGAGCRDTYSGSWNGIIARLEPRSKVNAYTGAFQPIPAFSGNPTIGRRLQVMQTDMSPLTYPNALYFVEGQYVCTEDANNGNWTNNASYGRVTVAAGSYAYTQASWSSGRPGIYAWQDNGGGIGVPDLTVSVKTVDIPGEGRFYVASKITQIGATWHYEYAISNFNSDRAARSFRIPLAAGAAVSNIGFHDVWYHDEDIIYDGTDWTVPASTFEVRWSSTQAYAQNQNANAIRFGTMYNFWFDSDRAPQPGQAEIDLFKPAVGCQPSTVKVGLNVPGAVCSADVVRNGAVDVNDLQAVIAGWGPCRCQYNCPADITGSNNAVDIDDLLSVITHWGGCP